jgi:antagonist of KipI
MPLGSSPFLKQNSKSSQRDNKEMKVFQVLKPGFFTTVQDLGRFGYLRYGVPVSGAMDTFSLTVANLLVLNSPSDAGLEITLIGPELQALARTQIAVTGGSVSPRINGQNALMWQTLDIEEGDVISFGKMESGCRAYLSVRCGVNTPLVLGSRSTYVRGGFGGVNGRQLKAGDMIDGFDGLLAETKLKLPEELVPRFTNHVKVNVILGPQAEMFTEKGINTFLSSQYEVTLESDRMGYRLEGFQIEHKGKADIVSDALLPGTVQVPKNGKPILIMRDAQTTGGYPKIAVTISSDLTTLGQAKPKDVIEFSEIALAEAHNRLQEQRRLLSNLSSMLVRSK